MTSRLGNGTKDLSGLSLGGVVARGSGERCGARAAAARAVLVRWRAGCGGVGCADAVAREKARAELAERRRGEATAARLGGGSG